MVYLLFAKQLRDSGLPADVLVGKLKKEISFALRRGTIAQVTTALDAAQRAVEDEPRPQRRGPASLDSLFLFRFDPFDILCLSSFLPPFVLFLVSFIIIVAVVAFAAAAVHSSMSEQPTQESPLRPVLHAVRTT